MHSLLPLLRYDIIALYRSNWAKRRSCSRHLCIWVRVWQWREERKRRVRSNDVRRPATTHPVGYWFDAFDIVFVSERIGGKRARGESACSFLLLTNQVTKTKAQRVWLSVSTQFGRKRRRRELVLLPLLGFSWNNTLWCEVIRRLLRRVSRRQLMLKWQLWDCVCHRNRDCLR